MVTVLDPAGVRELVGTQFPEVTPTTVTFLGEGCDNWAFDVDDRWVFRFPKRPDVERQIITEAHVLPLLAPRAPLAIPAYRFVGNPSPDYPYHFAGYAKLPGVTGIQFDWPPHRLRSVAPRLGSFLAWLHGVDPASLPVPLEQVEIGGVLAEMQADAIDELELVRRMAPDAPVDAWEQALRRDISPLVASTAQMVLIHNDLAAEHALIDPSTQAITGIIDWSDLAIGDPALDFAGLYHWAGDAFVEQVLAAYARPVEEGVRHRARFLAACRGAFDVAFGVERAREEYVRAGLRALEVCAV
jgi:aminoglycoside phosphotransferase (APT) family kinase protein